MNKAKIISECYELVKFVLLVVGSSFWRHSVVYCITIYKLVFVDYIFIRIND